MNKVYVTDYDYPSLEIEEKVFRDYGVTFIPTQSRSEADIIANCRDASGLLVQYARITEKIMDSLPGLKAISRYGVGFDTIDVAAATERGICVLNVPDYCIDEVSNQAFALIMDCCRRVTFLNNAVHNGIWDYAIAKPLHRLRGQKLGFVGFGKMARELARKATPFGLELLAYDPFLTQENIRNLPVKLQSLPVLLQEADIVSVHAPLTEQTYHLISDKELSLMKKTAILVNTSRGAVLDIDAVSRALAAHQIACAGIDVLETEPIAGDNPLLKLDNAIVTPHVSWYSEESEQELKGKVARGACEVLAGNLPAYLVNKDVLAKVSLR